MTVLILILAEAAEICFGFVAECSVHLRALPVLRG